MSSTEIIILAVGGITASVLYISRHLITSTCWTKGECCKIKLRADTTTITTPSSTTIITTPPPSPITISSVV